MTKKRVTCTGMTKQLYEQTFVSFLGQVVETRFNDFLGQGSQAWLSQFHI